MKQETKEAYANLINILFNGVIKAEAYQINDTVVKLVDNMVIDITKCSEAISSFGFDVIYETTAGIVAGLILDTFIDTLLVKLVTEEAVSTLLKKWVLKLSSGYQFIACLQTARLTYRSRIESELIF